MRIALAMDKNQSNKNKLLEKCLKSVCNTKDFEIINIGCKLGTEKISYVQTALASAILLNSNAVDFVVTGCGTANGVMILLNSMPNCYCGLIKSTSDAKLFKEINNGNCISIPFNSVNKTIKEEDLKNIFVELFIHEKPKVKTQTQQERCDSRVLIRQIKKDFTKDMLESLKTLDKDILEPIYKLPKFKDTISKYGNKDYLLY